MFISHPFPSMISVIIHDNHDTKESHGDKSVNVTPLIISKCHLS